MNRYRIYLKKARNEEANQLVAFIYKFILSKNQILKNKQVNDSFNLICIPVPNKITNSIKQIRDRLRQDYF